MTDHSTDTSSSASSSLPPSLRSWREALEDFTPTAQLTLGPWLPTLASALGPLMSEPYPAQRGAPDGYDDVHRYGSYEQLLPSEWAIAQVAPLEFLRRASSREQLHLRLAYHDPQMSLRSVALFDIGPDQMGSLRIVHLAILLVLQRRAEHMGASVLWGIIQRPDLGLMEATAPLIRGGLLVHRVSYPPSEQHREEWMNLLDELKASGDQGHVEVDCWAIGGAEVSMSGARIVHIDDTYQPGQPHAEVRVKSSRDVERMLTLALPQETVAYQMLRNPFVSLSQSLVDSRGRVTRPISASMNFHEVGRHLMLSNANGLKVCRVQKIKNTIKSSPYHHVWRRINYSGQLIAYGRRCRKFRTIVEKDRYLIHTCHQPVRLSLDEYPSFKSPSPTQEASQLISAGEFLIFSDALGALWLMHTEGYTLELIAGAASHPIVDKDQIFFLTHEWSVIESRTLNRVYRHQFDRRHYQPQRFELPPGPLRYYAHVQDGNYWITTSNYEDEHAWQIYDLRALNVSSDSLSLVKEIHAPPRAEVVGLCAIQGQPALLVVDESRFLLSTVSAHQEPTQLYRHSAPIELVAVGRDHGCVAIWDGQHALTLLEHEKGVLNIDHIDLSEIKL